MAFVIKNKFPIDLNKRKAVGFSLPFDGPAVFNPTYTTKEQLKSNLINYFLTNTGERFLNPSFGSNLRNTLFEGIVQDNLDTLQKRIKENLQQFFPIVDVENIEILSNHDQNQIKFTLTYSVVNFGIEDTIDLILQ